MCFGGILGVFNFYNWGYWMLTDEAVRAAAAKDKPYKIADGRGLSLFVSTSGHKSWRLKYRKDGKEQLMTLGSYPDVSLRDAREKQDTARKILREGRDPRHAEKRAKLVGVVDSVMTLEAVARRWHAVNQSKWKPVHASDVIRSLERDVFPDLGAMPMDEIDKPTLLAVLRQIEKRGAVETARRVKQRVAKIYRFASAEGADFINPGNDINDALKPVPPAKRHPALLDVNDIRKMLFAIDRAGASPITRLASRFLALTAQRPGMIRYMQWNEIKGIEWNHKDAPFNDAMWVVPSDKIKQELHLRSDESFEHSVPLSQQAVEILLAVWRLTGRGPYVFPGARSSHKPMSENAIGYLYNREGYQRRHVPHGWRSSFSTIMNEQVEREAGQDIRLHGDRLVIDLMLAHTPKGMSSAELRYNRAAYMPRRRELTQVWADKIMENALPAAQINLTPRRKPRS